MKKTVVFFLLLFPLLATWQSPVLADAPLSCSDAQVSCESPFVESDNFRQAPEDHETWADVLVTAEVLVSLHAWRAGWLAFRHDRNTDTAFRTRIIRAPPGQ